MKRLLLFILLNFCLINLYCQTHAEMSSQKWCGVNIDTIVGNNKYPDVVGIPQGFPFILYNVGTGCFITQGGDWAMEGRLFYSNFGRTMYLCENGRINSGITEKNISDTKNSFCTRPPAPYGKNWSDNNYSQFNLTTLMDGDCSKHDQTWVFERVEGEDTDTCTYYMYQTYGTSTKYYLGSVWGECHNSNIGKGNGQLVFMDDDRSCWTTAQVKGVTTKYELENGDKVELQKLYQWRLVSLEEFLRVLNSDKAGLNPSISALIPDRDFARNAIDFFAEDENPNHGWVTSELADYSYGSDKRYPFTWGNYKMGSDLNKNKQRSRGLLNEPWDSPVKLKAVFDSDKGQDRGKKDAKFGFLEFEGAGTIYSNFKVTKPGWYEITTRAFCLSDYNDAYMFARVIENSDTLKLEKEFNVPTVNSPEYGSIDLERLPSGTYQKETYEDCLVIGKELLINGEEHKRKVWVLITEEDFLNDKRTIRVGIRKDAATKTSYDGGYYDKDLVCVDDFQAIYMGMAPAFFYEDMETLDYLDDIDHESLYLQNEYPKQGIAGQYGGSVSLQRKFTADEWNSFSFILPLTGEQVRNAFGDNSKLLELDGIGTLSRNECIIDFKTVDLITLDYVIVPGKLYLIKPSSLPVYGESPRKEKAYYYDLGRMFFSVKEEDSSYKYPTLDLTQLPYNYTEVGSYLEKNDGVEHVTYVQTFNYDIFRVDKNGKVLSKVNAQENTYCPKGSYVMSGGKMYELSRDTPLKGFRGWITLTHSIFDRSNNIQTGMAFSIDGVLDSNEEQPVTRLKNINIENTNIDNENIYDLLGRKVSKQYGSLPKGLYIIKGKKFLAR